MSPAEAKAPLVAGHNEEFLPHTPSIIKSIRSK